MHIDRPPIPEHAIVQGPLREGKSMPDTHCCPGEADDMAYGHVRVNMTNPRDYETARDYLSKDPVLRSTFLRLEDGLDKDGNEFCRRQDGHLAHGYVHINESGVNQYTIGGGIQWSPTQGLQGKDPTQRQPPAVPLGHEMLHAIHDVDHPKEMIDRLKTPDPIDTNAEEKYTRIQEADSCKNLSSEDQEVWSREIYSGTHYTTKGITSTEPDEYDP